jgi:hypothetical protein
LPTSLDKSVLNPFGIYLITEWKSSAVCRAIDIGFSLTDLSECNGGLILAAKLTEARRQHLVAHPEIHIHSNDALRDLVGGIVCAKLVMSD